MSRAPAARYPDGGAVARAVADWLDGARRRERALEVVARAEALAPQVAGWRAQAAALRARAEAGAAERRPWDPVEARAAIWADEDSAEALERRADLRELERIQLLQAAFTHQPALPEAHAALAAHYRARFADAEARRDARAARRFEKLLRAHDRGEHADWLAGDGALSLGTDPPGAACRLFRFATRQRRLVPVLERDLGRSPVASVALPRGSYLVEIQRPGGAGHVRYPVHLERCQRWEGAVWLPPRGALDAGSVYVPAGWFVCGGDPEGYNALERQRVWVDGFAIRRFQVTNTEYLEFLNELLREGREEDALAWAPRERPTTAGEPGTLLYGRGRRGRFEIVPDADGDVWGHDWPVVHVGWAGAAAYARWLSEETGQPWRLPTEYEWEKASRGVDGRFYPWGDHFEATWCCMQDSTPGRPLPVGVDTYPVDESVYGARGMAGNVRDWCADPWDDRGPPRVEGRAQPAAQAEPDPRYAVRGGGWSGNEHVARCARRVGYALSIRFASVGFRLARDLGPR